MNRTSPYLNLGLFGTLATAFAFVIYAWSMTFDPTDISSFQTMTFIALVGLVCSFIFVGFPVGTRTLFSLNHLSSDIIATGISFLSLYYVSRIATPTSLGVSPINQQIFLTLSGVAEEWFFRSWLCLWIYKLTDMSFIAIPASSFAWAMFHIARYGYGTSMFFVVFLAGLALGAVTVYFKSADGAMFGHMLFNFLAGA